SLTSRLGPVREAPARRPARRATVFSVESARIATVRGPGGARGFCSAAWPILRYPFRCRGIAGRRAETRARARTLRAADPDRERRNGGGVGRASLRHPRIPEDGGHQNDAAEP